MSTYADIVKAIRDKAAKSPEKERLVLLAFADTLQGKEGQILETGSAVILRTLSLISAAGGTDAVKEFIVGNLLSPEELIKGMRQSANVFKTAKPELRSAAETILDILVSFGAKALFALWTEKWAKP